MSISTFNRPDNSSVANPTEAAKDPSRLDILSPVEPAVAPGLSDAPALIQVEDVSKQFIVRTGQVGDLRERFTEWRKRRQSNAASVFQALQHVSFEVQRGQSVGIVGHNGSGKSTILKMLTGILKPTSGRIAITGRVGALIEVGAGFHPDLSGRENVYLNGSILGMSRRDIDQRMDAIISFAGLEEHIDKPVKRYSSGMYMRLGFSVAAHTDPDILLIDEVLAVGDLLFQRKCLRHLKEFTARGGTLVFVSHAMDQVRQVCDTCVWLDHGQVRFVGNTDDAIEQYFGMVAEREDDEFRRDYPEEWAAREAEKEEARQEAEEAQARQVRAVEETLSAQEAAHRTRVLNPSLPCLLTVQTAVSPDAESDESASTIVAAGHPLTVRVGYRVPGSRSNLVVGIEIFRADGLYVWGASNYQYGVELPVEAGKGQLQLDFGAVPLAIGEYRLRVSLFPEPKTPGWDRSPEDVLETAAHFTITNPVASAGVVALSINGWQISTAFNAARVPVA